jgi:hypothetical protein
MKRRQFLKIAGSTAVILAASGAGFVATRTPEAALAPWGNAGSQYSDPMRRALSYAILSSNPHNRQPWVVDLKSETEAVLTCDLDRLLPVTDPFSRQIVIGLGCFLELFSLAAASNGYRADITYFPKGEPGEALDQRPIAHLSLVKQSDLKPDPLFAQTLNRHTNREAYDTRRPIGKATLDKLLNAPSGKVSTGGTVSGRDLQDLRILTRDAMITEIRTPDAYQESVDLMRIGRREIEANPDGIALGGAFLESLSLVGILTRESVSDPKTQSFQVGLDMVDAGAMSSMGFVWITTEGNDRITQIEAGRAYMRIALETTAQGLVMQPMSQALQEYEAMIPYYKAVHNRFTNRGTERMQMLARIGYAKTKIEPSPRWPLATRITGA